MGERYTELRLRAAALNHEHGWATDAEFAAVLPTLESVPEIESWIRRWVNRPFRSCLSSEA